MPDEPEDITEYLHAYQDDGAYHCVVCGENALVHRLALRAHAAELRAATLTSEVNRLKSEPPSRQFGARPVF